jgi:hypothetical protein
MAAASAASTRQAHSGADAASRWTTLSAIRSASASRAAFRAAASIMQRSARGTGRRGRRPGSRSGRPGGARRRLALAPEADQPRLGDHVAHLGDWSRPLALRELTSLTTSSRTGLGRMPHQHLGQRYSYVPPVRALAGPISAITSVSQRSAGRGSPSMARQRPQILWSRIRRAPKWRTSRFASCGSSRSSILWPVQVDLLDPAVHLDRLLPG